MRIAAIVSSRRLVGLAGAAVLLLAAGCGDDPQRGRSEARQVAESPAAPAGAGVAVGDRGPGERPLNLLLIVLDTLRADRLGVYGSARRASPRIDAFAREAIVFEAAFAPAPHTAPSHASLFTSTYPAAHGVWNEVVDDDGERVFPALAPGAITLAEVLYENGYETRALADGGWLTPGRGLAQGFQRFHSKTKGVANRFRRAAGWLGQRDDPRPFFLFLHTYEVHAPYLPPPGYEDRFGAGYQGPVRDALEAARVSAATIRIEDPLSDLHRRHFAPLLDALGPADRDFLLALYDAELSLVDEELGRLVDFLRESGRLRDTIVVVTADHGEEFGEHGKFTHQQVYHEHLHVPLIVHLPQGPHGVRRHELVDLVDVMPTLLAALGVPAPASVQGRVIDLAAKTTVPAAGDDRLLVGEVNRPGGEREVAVRGRDYSAVFHDRDLVRVEVYANGADPLQRSDLSGDEAAARFAAAARDAVRAHWQQAGRHREAHALAPVVPEAAPLSEEKRAELRMLGYVE